MAKNNPATEAAPAEAPAATMPAPTQFRVAVQELHYNRNRYLEGDTLWLTTEQAQQLGDAVVPHAGAAR